MKIQVIFATLFFIALCGVSAFAQKASPSTVQPVRDVDQAARQPFSRLLSSNSTFGPVPDGKVLVLEFISAKVASGESGTGGICLFTYYQGNVETAHTFAPSYYTEHVSSNKTYITQSMKIYVPAGRTIQTLWQGDVTPVFFTATLSGHYVDVP